MARRRGIPSGAIAVAVHLGALLALRPWRPLPLPPLPAAAESLDAIALEDDPAPATESPPPSPVAGERATASPGARLASRASHPPSVGPGSAPGPESTAQPAPAPAAPPAPTADDGWTFESGKAADWTGPGAVASALREGGREAGGDGDPGAATPTTGVSKSGGLVEGLDARDAALGMGRGGGVVVSALEIAARDDPTFAEGTATFDVGIDSSGRVTVALLHASQSFQSWAHVGEAMRGSLDPRAIRIPPGATGWHVTATVEAKVQYPNAADPKKMGTHFIARPPRIVENKHRETIGDPPIIIEGPVLAFEHSGKICSIRLELGTTPISGSCDPTNIGLHPLRVVHGHVVSEGRL